MFGSLVRRHSAAARPARAVLAILLLASTAPALAQSAPADGEARLRKVEAEVRALQRQVFPGSDGKFFTPEVTSGAVRPQPAGVPASTPMSDLLTRMESVEAQIARLTAQNEETANRVAQMEAKLAALTPPPAPVAAAVADPAPTAPTLVAAPVAAPAPALVKPVAAVTPVKEAPVKAGAAPKPVVPAKPTAQRLAAVQKVEKPATGNAADDEYTYGFRLYDAKFYPEAQQQLRLYVDKYPRDSKISFGRNLLGKAFLDDGKPRDAGAWFVQNYQSDRKGARAADSLLNLAEAMRQLKDTSRACIALAEFGEVYPVEAAGRLKAQFASLRGAVKCD
ncbi:hypothetical protein H7F51_18490 [Novosphingobium flavum]|uniref:TolA-binding protein n=1 Tax=Novosphingobium flavum TaxID=1778672 RepID=A0A7X1KNC8_9SPHN|nr:hypothetical protein [Novosphingobium flavum]MBC2667512.1 hypothetical protein [Novosphingobium flavum]